MLWFYFNMLKYPRVWLKNSCILMLFIRERWEIYEDEEKERESLTTEDLYSVCTCYNLFMQAQLYILIYFFFCSIFFMQQFFLCSVTLGCTTQYVPFCWEFNALREGKLALHNLCATVLTSMALQTSEKTNVESKPLQRALFWKSI